MTTSKVIAEARRLDAKWREAFARQQANDTPQRARAEAETWNALRDGRASLGLCLDPYCFYNYPCPAHDA
jgi:hypothetical protein